MLSEKSAGYIRKSIAAGAIACLPLFWNFSTNYNVRVDTSHTLYLKKMEGWISYSKIELSYSRGDLVMAVFDPLGGGSRRYSDIDRDGILDEVMISLPLFGVSGPKGSFNRDEHDKTHAEILQKENSLYRQHLKEFACRFPEDMKRLGLENFLKF